MIMTPIDCLEIKLEWVKRLRIQRVHHTSGGGTVMRDEFKYSGKRYRIDLENLRGINLVE